MAPCGTARPRSSTASWPPRNRLVSPLVMIAGPGGPGGLDGPAPGASVLVSGPAPGPARRPLERGPRAADGAAWPKAPAALPWGTADRTDAGRTATASQPLPTTVAPDTAGRCAGSVPVRLAGWPGVTVCRLAPFGGE